MLGVEYRLQSFLRPVDRRCLMVDASAGLSLGARPGLENFAQALQPLLAHADGVVCSPGQIGRLAGLQKSAAGLLVRTDWTNVHRGSDFVLPVETPQRLSLLPAQDALELGAAGMVTSFLLGYDEEIEAACLRSTVQLALEGKALGLPLVVEVCTTGPRVSIPDKAVELGVSYALEGGADMIAFPYPGRHSLETLAAFVSVPWLIKPTTVKITGPGKTTRTGQNTISQEKVVVELEEALSLGAAGLWLDHTLFALPEPGKLLADLNSSLHPDLVGSRG